VSFVPSNLTTWTSTVIIHDGKARLYRNYSQVKFKLKIMAQPPVAEQGTGDIAPDDTVTAFQIN
jgi:hypothetical protein